MECSRRGGAGQEAEYRWGLPPLSRVNPANVEKIERKKGTDRGKERERGPLPLSSFREVPMNFATLNKKWFHEVNISVTIPSPTQGAHARSTDESGSERTRRDDEDDEDDDHDHDDDRVHDHDRDDHEDRDYDYDYDDDCDVDDDDVDDDVDEDDDDDEEEEEEDAARKDADHEDEEDDDDDDDDDEDDIARQGRRRRRRPRRKHARTHARTQASRLACTRFHDDGVCKHTRGERTRVNGIHTDARRACGERERKRAHTYGNSDVRAEPVRARAERETRSCVAARRVREGQEEGGGRREREKVRGTHTGARGRTHTCTRMHAYHETAEKTARERRSNGQTEPRANQVLWPVAFPITLRLGSPPVCPKEAAGSWSFARWCRPAR